MSRRWQAAEKMHRELLEERRRTLARMSNHANVLDKQGKWEEAEEMHRDVLERRRVLGIQNQDTLRIISNLAHVLDKQGRWEEAEEMHREVLDKRCRTLGEEHEATLASMSNLAHVLDKQGKWEEAEEMHRDVLERRRVLGIQNRNTHRSISNLANVLGKQGKWEEAEELHREVLEKRCRTLGEEHEATLASMSKLANVIDKQGRWEEAEEMHREVLDKSCRTLGEEHEATLASMSNLAHVLDKKGKWEEAEEMHRDVLERRRVLGIQNPDTLPSISNLANVLDEQGKWEEAEEMHRELLGKMRGTLVEEHEATLASMNNLARPQIDATLRFQDEVAHQERFKSTVKHLRCVIGALEEANMAEDHPDLLSYRQYLVGLLVQGNEPKMLCEAEELLQLIIPSLCDTFGVAHHFTQRAIGTLVFLLEDEDRHEEAEPWQHYLQAVATAQPFRDLDFDIPEERTENSDGANASLSRGLLGFGTQRYVKVVASDETSSAPFGANKVPEAPGSASSDSNVITAQERCKQSTSKLRVIQ